MTYANSAIAETDWPAPVGDTRAYVSPGSYVPENGSRSASQIGVPYWYASGAGGR